MRGYQVLDAAERAAPPIPTVGPGAVAASLRPPSEPQRRFPGPETGWGHWQEWAARRISGRGQRLWNRLTAREIEVAQLVAMGKRNKEVASEMHLSRYTVETHLKNIYDKLQIQSRTELTNVVRDIAVSR
jgi:DNA-binding NarL/FixJ family response regulator